MPSSVFPSVKRARSGLFASLLLAAATAAAADPTCPPPPAAAAASTVADTPPPEGNHVEVTSAGAELSDSGQASLKGPVRVRQGERTLSASEATYDPNTQTFDAKGNVEFHDPKITVSGDSARWLSNGGGAFSNAQFEIPARQARGHADSITLQSTGQLDLRNVEYTACPAEHRDWVLRAKRIDIDQQAQEGFGRNVRLDFLGVPILYLPAVSFPVGDARKSGFLFPTVGVGSPGTELEFAL